MGPLATTFALIYTVPVFLAVLFSVNDIDRFWPYPMIPLIVGLVPVWLLTAWVQ